MNSGFQGDELLHINTGHHLAFGYMEFPPLIGLLSYIQNLFESTSVFIHHLFAHLASVLIFIFSALTVIALGGKKKAVFLVLLCILCSVAFTRSHQLFQPVVFSQLFWILSFFLLSKFVTTLKKRYLLYLTISLAIGFLTKYDILFFIIGLPSLFFFKFTRKTLLNKSTLAYVAIFILIVLPNIIWQYNHNFPVIQHMNELRVSQLASLKYSDILTNIFVHLNPVSAILWISGLVLIFSKSQAKEIKQLGSTILVSIAFLLLFKGKAYYFFPAMICLMILGAIYLEKILVNPKAWLIYPVIILLLISGVVMLPYGMPILKKDKYLAYTQIEKQGEFYPIPAQEFYSQELWPKTMLALKDIYSELPDSTRHNLVIWAKHYKQAGAISLYGEDFGLPSEISYHGSYYEWAPDKGDLPNTILALGTEVTNIEFFKTYFESVKEVKKVINIYADEEEDRYQRIYLCERPTVSYEELKILFSDRIFE